MRQFVLIGFLLITSALAANSQFMPKQYALTEDSDPLPRLLSNTVVDIVAEKPSVDSTIIWFATAKGLSKTTNAGDSWLSYTHDHNLGKGSVTAIAIKDGAVWVATAYDSSIENISGVGGGLSYTTDGGLSWTHFPQPVDDKNDSLVVYASGDKLKALPITTPINNITYDMAITKDDRIWTASFAGMLRVSSDKGVTWERVVLPPDNLDSIDPGGSYHFNLSPVNNIYYNVKENFNHRVFSVIAEHDSVLWVGTAGGINKSTDGGISWDKFNHQNQTNPISGNFVVALAHQRYDGRNSIWAATWKANDPSEYYGVSKTDNGGLTWETMLEGERVHNFGFQDSIVYAVSDNGLWKSADGGVTWGNFPQIVDEESGERVYYSEMYAVKVIDGMLWVGTADGLARSTDGGNTWTIFRSFVPTGEHGEPDTYAFPNPFSPLRGDIVRLQYHTNKDTKVTINIYDFALDLVKTLIDGDTREPGDFSEVWDGRNGKGDVVANGVYYYTVEKEGDEIARGKIVVLD